ncbi:MAG TPA: DoxX family protein [Firmicutes bacterium]|nr:DoxX family protein [Bacillota bacterium]
MLRGFFVGGANVQSVAANLGLLIGRLGWGLLLALLHGLGKLPPSERFIGGVETLGFPAPTLFAWAAALAEFAGGLLVAAGLLTRPAALAIVFTMVVAAFMRHGADPMEKKELALVYLTFGLLYLIVGAGKYSIDWLISHGRRRA